jgi:hypothetical protein
VFGGVFFRKDISALAKRLRKGGPAEFDPSPQPQGTLDAAAASRALTMTGTKALANMPSSPTTAIWEKLLLNSEPLKATTNAVEREQILVRVAARSIVIGLFEVAEANIYASQVALLEYLNLNRNGAPYADLKARFYDNAVQQAPSIYERYSFDQYLGFLQRQSFVSVDNGLIRISPQGIEYLAWRAEQGKPQRLVG